MNIQNTTNTSLSVFQAAEKNTIKDINKTLTDKLKEKGISEEYLPQIQKEAGRAMHEFAKTDFLDYLLGINSNIYGDWGPQTELQKQFSTDWFENYVFDYYTNIIDAMGDIDDPKSKWMDPKLFDLLRRSELAK